MRRRKVSRGFTLVEVLLVLVIIGLLAGVAFFTIGGTQEKAKKQTTELKLKKVAGAVNRFQMATQKLPPTEGGLDMLVAAPDAETYPGWDGPYLAAEDLVDAYGERINYENLEEAGGVETGETGGAKYRLWSNGPNKQNDQGDQDDILPSSVTTETDGGA